MTVFKKYNTGIAAWEAIAVGKQGEKGEGVPTGGTQDQVLAKVSATDYDTAWITLNFVDAAGAVSAIKSDADWNATDWDTAFGWGDHSVAGYLTTETDPVVGAVTGIVKADGAGNISAAVADTDYQSPLTAGTDYLEPSSIGVTVQGYDADTAKYDDTTANFTGTLQEGGENVVTANEVGTIASQDASNVSITGGSVTGITDLAVEDGGTGASDASTARTNLGLGNVDNVSAADLRDRSTHTGTQALSTISDAGTIASQDANSVNIDGGNIDGTPIGVSSASSGAFTTLTASDDVNFDSGTLFVDASADAVGIGTTNPSSLLELDGLGASAVLRVNNTGAANKGIEFMRGGVVDGSLFMDANEDINLNYRQSDLAGRDFYIRNGSLGGAVFSCFSDSTISMGPNGNDVNIDSSGNVGVGTTNPTCALQIAAQGSASTPTIGLSDNNTGFFRPDFNAIGFTNNGSESMRIDSSGHAIIPAGVTLGTSAGVYNAPNTLDDYEEGTFTATLTSATPPTNPPTSIAAFYTKIGSIVRVQAYFANVDTSGGSGEMRVTGLPFNSQNVANSFSQGQTFRNGLGTGTLVCNLGINSSTLTFRDDDVLTAPNFNIVAGPNKYLNLNIVYITS